MAFPLKSFNRDLLKHLKVGMEKHKLHRFGRQPGKPKENDVFDCPFLSVDSDTRGKKTIFALKRKCHLAINICGVLCG